MSNKRMATEKQINYFLSLHKKWVTKLKREYRYYNKSTSTSLINAFYRDIKNDKSDEIPMKDMSLVINIMLDDINS